MKTLTIDHDGLKIEIPGDLVEDYLDRAGYIPASEADEHCDHDLDAAHDEGVAEGRRRGGVDPDSASGAILELWHNEHHAGVYRFCYEQPCHDLRKAAGE